MSSQGVEYAVTFPELRSISNVLMGKYFCNAGALNSSFTGPYLCGNLALITSFKHVLLRLGTYQFNLVTLNLLM